MTVARKKDVHNSGRQRHWRFVCFVAEIKSAQTKFVLLFSIRFVLYFSFADLYKTVVSSLLCMTIVDRNRAGNI